jgi:hypothetical protein
VHMMPIHAVPFAETTQVVGSNRKRDQTRRVLSKCVCVCVPTTSKAKKAKRKRQGGWKRLCLFENRWLQQQKKGNATTRWLMLVSYMREASE